MPGARKGPLADAVAAVLGPGGTLSAELPSWEPRPGQLAMATRVAEAIENDERLICEAGTGTGKTLAYLVPAILSGRKVVVATGTKTLQDQIARLDLPRLAAVLEQPFSYSVMKGLSNYVCLRRLSEQRRQLRLEVGGAAEEMARLEAFVLESASGDKGEATMLAEDAPLWREVTAAPELRLGKRCQFYERCFVTRMRDRASEAQVVVANHHLFFADLALKAHWPEAQVLPPYEVVIFDEAHQIEEVATELYGLHVSSQRLFALARDVGRSGSKDDALLSRMSSLSRRLMAITEAWASALRDRLPAPTGDTDEVRVPTPEDLWQPGPHNDGPLARYHELDTVLEETEAFFIRLSQPDAPLPWQSIASRAPPTPGEAAAFGGLSRRAASLRTDMARMVDGNRRDHVRWVTASVRNVSLRASPIDVGPLIGAAFDAHPGPLVFTSATLSTGGSGRGFHYFRQRLGLEDTAAEASFPSPFNYHQQALLYLATDLPDPTGPSFPMAAAARMHELCVASRGRALLLFTSFRNLRLCEALFRQRHDFPLLVQGERPRHALLEDLRRQLGSVLLATQGFWEGVDVPGEALSLVAMDRLPFAVPVDPLTAARIDHIREAGGDPFGSYQLPSAALALKQGFGRLIRSRRDRGVVAVLDGRISRRSYGQTLLESLPRTCPRTESIEDVAAFFAPPDSDQGKRT